MATPRVEISAPTPDAQEGGASAVLRVRRIGGNMSSALGVKLEWSGSAKANEIRGEPDVVIIPARAKSVEVIIGAIDDKKREAVEVANFDVVPGKRYRVTKDTAATVRVIDASRGDGTLKWTPAASAPVGRVEPETVVVGDKLYAFSGYTDDRWQPIRRVDRYDPATNRWTKLGDMPIGLTHAAVAVVGTKVWFAGGYTARPGTMRAQDIALTTVKIYDTLRDTWSDGPALPQQRASGGLGLIDNTLYFAAGENRARQSQRDTWALDLSNLAAGWKACAPIPEGKTHFGTAVIDDQMYVMGGQDGVDATATIVATAHKYDPKTNRWTRLANLPTPMSHYSPSTVVRGGKILMFGGELRYTVESNQVLEYDPLANSYRKLTSLPVTRATPMAGVIGDKIIFSSGLDDGWHNETYIGTFE